MPVNVAVIAVKGTGLLVVVGDRANPATARERACQATSFLLTVVPNPPPFAAAVAVAALLPLPPSAGST